MLVKLSCDSLSSSERIGEVSSQAELIFSMWAAFMHLHLCCMADAGGCESMSGDAMVGMNGYRKDRQGGGESFYEIESATDLRSMRKVES